MKSNCQGRVWPTGAVSRWGLLLCCLFASTTTYAQMGRLFTVPPRDRIAQLLADPFWTNGDSAMVGRQLDSLVLLADQHDDSYLNWYARFLKIRSQLHYQKNQADAVRYLESVRPTVENYPIPSLKPAFWHIYGLYLVDQKELEPGFRLMLQAQQAFETMDYGNVPEIIEYFYGLGSVYFRYGDYRNAIHFLELADRYRPRQPLRLRTNILNTMGVAYQELHDYPKAAQSFRLALREAELTRDMAYMGIATGNLGNTLRLQGQLHKALPYLYRDLALSETVVPENCAVTCLYIAKTLMALDSTAKAKTYIDRSVGLAAHQKLRSIYVVNYAEAQALYAKKTGNFRRAVFWTDSTTRLNDSLRAVFDTKLLLLTENQQNAEKYVATLQTVTTEKENAVRIRNLIIAGLFLLTGFGLYGFYQNRQKRLREQQLHEARLAHATEQLNQYLSSLHDKNDLIAQITDELTQARSMPPTAVSPSESNQLLDALFNSVILTEKDWQQFRQLFEQTHPHFFDTLRQNYSDLTPTDLRLLALSKLNIPTREMAFMLGVSMDAIRKSRHRLRKKLEQNHADTDLEGLLAQL